MFDRCNNHLADCQSQIVVSFTLAMKGFLANNPSHIGVKYCFVFFFFRGGGEFMFYVLSNLQIADIINEIHKSMTSMKYFLYFKILIL